MSTVTANSEQRLSHVFHALADPTRRKILSRIATENLTVAELREPFTISAPAISKHLKVLERAELIERIKDGKQRRFSLNTTPLQDAQSVINELAIFWTTRLDKLDEILANKSSQPNKKNGKI